MIEVPVRRSSSRLASLIGAVAEIPGAIVCGGYARWALSPHYDPKPFGDVDIGFYGSKSAAVGFEHVRAWLSTARGTTWLRDTRGATTFVHNGLPVQLLKPERWEAADAEELLGRFGLSICQAGLRDSEQGDECGIVGERFEMDEQRQLIWPSSSWCLYSLPLHIAKYAAKGYRMEFSAVRELWRLRDAHPEELCPRLHGYGGEA